MEPLHTNVLKENNKAFFLENIMKSCRIYQKMSKTHTDISKNAYQRLVFMCILIRHIICGSLVKIKYFRHESSSIM